jgi:hypothetical protein
LGKLENKSNLENMICVQLNGGLGNQMFQYACGRSLAYKNNTDLVFDLSRINLKTNKIGITKRSFQLDIFQLGVREVTNMERKKIKPLLYRMINIISIKILSKGIQTPIYFIERKIGYNNKIENIRKNCFLSGYWQSEKYFKYAESLIRDEFTFPKYLNSENTFYLNKIKHTNSISLHIRRTDFVNNESHDVHGICTIDYYLKAVYHISSLVENPVYYIFSDEIEWAKKNLKLLYETYYITGNSGDSSYIDMLLMSNCKHNIIANSSFSWWGAWLNQNQNNIIIAPKNWFLNKKLNDQTGDLIPDSWIRM